MNMLSTVSERFLGTIAVTTGMGAVAADVIPLPTGFETWPATAILGCVCLAALGLVALKVRQDAGTVEALRALSVSITQSVDAQKEATAAILSRPCVADKK